MTLILNQIFSGGGSGVITLEIPAAESGTTQTIKGLLVNDPSIKVRNQWGSVLPDTQDLNQFMTVLGSQNLYSWVSASAASWKACDPLSMGVDFYLLSIDKNSNIKAEASALLKLAALTPGDAQFVSEASVHVHGGYKIDFWTPNDDLSGDTISAYLSGAASQLMTPANQSKNGTVTMHIGNQIVLRNMLLDEAQVEHSSVQVAEGIPLYIKISATFRMFRAPLVADIEGIYG